MYSVRKALTEGTALAILGIGGLTLAAFIPTPKTGLFGTDFASRWDGECSGFTKWDVALHAFGNLQLWWSYIVIAVVLQRLHPAMPSVKESQRTLWFTVAFFTGCGFVHLFNSYTNFVPMYRLEGLLKITVGTISMISAYYIAFSLNKAFKIVEGKRRRADQLERLIGKK